MTNIFRITAAGSAVAAPAQLMRQLMAVMIHWFPQHRLIFVGDGHYGNHELARFVHRHRRHIVLVSRFHPDANLFDAPPQRTGRVGRPRVRGAKRPKPCEEVARRKRRRRHNVAWYGGGREY